MVTRIARVKQQRDGKKISQPRKSDAKEDKAIARKVINEMRETSTLIKQAAKLSINASPKTKANTRKVVSKLTAANNRAAAKLRNRSAASTNRHNAKMVKVGGAKADLRKRAAAKKRGGKSPSSRK